MKMIASTARRWCQLEVKVANPKKKNEVVVEARGQLLGCWVRISGVMRENEEGERVCGIERGREKLD